MGESSRDRISQWCLGEETLGDDAEDLQKEQVNKDIIRERRDSKERQASWGVTSSCDSDTWQINGQSASKVGRTGSVLSLQMEPEFISEKPEAREGMEEPQEVHQELATVLGEHLNKLQHLLQVWTQEQVSILKNGKAVGSDWKHHRSCDYPFFESPSVRTSPSKTELRVSSVGPTSPADARPSSYPIYEDSDWTSPDKDKSADIKKPSEDPDSLPMGKQKSSNTKQPIGKVTLPLAEVKDAVRPADSEKVRKSSSGEEPKSRRSDAGRKSVLFDRHTSIESHVTESVRNRSDQINAQLERLNFARTSRGKQRSRILDDGVPEASFRISRKLAPVVNSAKFDSACSLVILLNACIMGVSADYAISDPHNPDVPVLEFLEAAFCVFYTFEVTVRLLVQGCDYFCGYGCSWNWFDLALVVHSLYDQIQTMVAAELNDGGVNNLSFLRLLRLMKMLRLLRIIRLMKMFKELRMMLFSMLGSMKAMMWACVFIAMISYMFGICVLQGCTLYLQGGGTKGADQILLYWGSIGTAMLSLFKSSTAGQNWGEIAGPLEEVGFFFYALFVLYVAFFAFVVVNTLTSIFVEVTMENSEKDNQMVIQLELEKKNMYMTRLQAFYDEINNDENGCISYEDFCDHLQNPKMMAFAASLDLDILNAKQFFFMLSENGTRPVDVETFVVGCIKLKGLAKNMDLMDLIYTFKKNQAEQKQHGAFVRAQFDGMKQILTDARLGKRLDKIEASLTKLQRNIDVEEPAMDPSSGERHSRKSLVL